MELANNKNMKRLKCIILTICIVSSIHFYMRQLADDEPQDISIKDGDNDSVILFFTETDDDTPSGQYWPASQTMHASAYIDDDSYSDVTQSKEPLIHQSEPYLGYFIDTTSKEKFYLYATKDLIEPDDEDANNNGIIMGDSGDSDDN